MRNNYYDIRMSELTLSDVGKRFGKTVALADVTLRVKSGEFVCLLGSSGCGKTTLLRIIAGLEKNDHGELHLDGVALSKLPSHKRNIGMVFQSLALFPHLNVSGNIAYGLKMRGVSAEFTNARVAELLALTGLVGFESRRLASLSGGQKQRVAIARALALEPQLFLMDEPFSALDAGLRDHLQLEVKKLQRQLGVTTIFVTHDQSEAMSLADRIVILNNGNIEQAGTPKEVYQRPATRFVAEFIGNNNLLDVDIDAKVKFKNNSLGQPQGIIENLYGRQTLVIRPETITLHAPEGSGRYLQGVVTMQRTAGALVECDIEVDGQTLKHTALQNTGPEVSIGDTVGLSWDWSQIWCLPGESQ